MQNLMLDQLSDNYGISRSRLLIDDDETARLSTLAASTILDVRLYIPVSLGPEARAKLTSKSKTLVRKKSKSL